MATAKKAPVKTVKAKATSAKKSIKSKAAPKANKIDFKGSADKAVNVYLGLIGKGLDIVQEKIEDGRKDSKKRVSMLETRGVKLRKNLTKRVNDIDMPDVESINKDVKEQIKKVQAKVEDVQAKVEDAVEDVVDSLKGNQKSA